MSRRTKIGRSTARITDLRINRPKRANGTTSKRGPRLPVGPLKEFVEELIAREERAVPGARSPGKESDFLGPTARVSCLLGVDERQIYKWRYEADYVSEFLADAALTNEGSRHLGDLWPDRYLPDALEEVA